MQEVSGCNVCKTCLPEECFFRNNKPHKTCNDCAEKKQGHPVDDRPYMKCKKCEKKYYNIGQVPVEEIYTKRGVDRHGKIWHGYKLPCDKHGVRQCLDCRRPNLRHPFYFDHNPAEQQEDPMDRVCNPCWFKKYVNVPHSHGNRDHGNFWEILKNMTVRSTHLVDDRVPPEERDGKDVINYNLCFNTGRETDDYVEWDVQKLLALFW